MCLKIVSLMVAGFKSRVVGLKKVVGSEKVAGFKKVAVFLAWL